MKSKTITTIIKYFLSSLIVGLVLGGAWQEANKNEEYPVIDILAVRDIDQALKIYAQFNATQTLMINERTLIKKIILPIYLPPAAASVDIILRNDGQIINQWQLNKITDINRSGIHEIELLLPDNTWLAGQYSLTWDGRIISSQQQETAPRLFIEKDNGRYADGNFWIASNSKEGDISLRVIGQRYKWERYWQEVQGQWGKIIQYSVAYLMALWLLAAAPHALWPALSDHESGGGQVR